MNNHNQLRNTSQVAVPPNFLLSVSQAQQPFFPFRVSKQLWPYPKALQQIYSHFCAKANPSVCKTNFPAHVIRISITRSWMCSLHGTSILAGVSCSAFTAEPGPPGQRWGSWWRSGGWLTPVTHRQCLGVWANPGVPWGCLQRSSEGRCNASRSAR